MSSYCSDTRGWTGSSSWWRSHRAATWCGWIVDINDRFFDNVMVRVTFWAVTDDFGNLVAVRP